MIKNLAFLCASLFVLTIFSSQSNADYIVDFTGVGLHPKVSKSINTGSYTGTSFVQSNANNIFFSATDTGGSKTASVRYDFTNGLNDFLGGLKHSQSNLLVRFEVAMDTNIRSAGGAITVTGRYFNSGSSTGTVFSTLTNPDSVGRQVMYTDRTMGELQTNDIDAVEWTVSYNGAGSIGFQNDFTFGSSGGLIAAPEPTSAAMIGCALVGLVARRRRKA